MSDEKNEKKFLCEFCGGDAKMTGSGDYVLCLNPACAITGPVKDKDGEQWDRLMRLVRRGRGSDVHRLSLRMYLADLQAFYQVLNLAYGESSVDAVVCKLMVNRLAHLLEVEQAAREDAREEEG